ncbi:BQ2448_5089 [Microbotryum intermedium]|uniref:BQ2448_5089 protein n=1 Tax=Microbotryum intermedium TaxID=269621 RepID=A0A238F8J8_9BASI|nr:BQ2448_5089 [Microbotryum intermedium]
MASAPRRGLVPIQGAAQSAQSATLADLTAPCRRTTGRRPPPLAWLRIPVIQVGCSITLIDDHTYVFGGRLVPNRTMVDTLYCLSLRTLEWQLLWPPTRSENGTEAEDPNSPTTPKAFAGPAPRGPTPRYFHSAEAWGKKLVVAFGEGYSSIPSNPEGGRSSSDSKENGGSGAEMDSNDGYGELFTLRDVCIWDIEKKAWEMPEIKCAEGVQGPEARYAHLACVTTVGPSNEVGRDRPAMVIMGGQDIKNTYLHSISVLDLDSLTWVRSSTWDRHIGTYRAVVTSATKEIHPSTSFSTSTNGVPTLLNEGQKHASQQTVTGAETSDDLAPGREPMRQLSYSSSPDPNKPQPLLLFSNFNFTQVRRDLDLLVAPTEAEDSLSATSLSSLMGGNPLPPGLRFPTGKIIGHHLLIFGTFLSQTVNNFSIWALDLGPRGASGLAARAAAQEPLTWSRIEPGSVLSTGSWNRALVWGNSVAVIGDRERDIAIDYDHRQTNFAHIAFVDLEAFGVYQPPRRVLPPLAQSLGLLTLAQPHLSDFELRCSDGVRLSCSRKLLVDRWPWFKTQLDEFKLRAKGMMAAQQRRVDAAHNHNSSNGDYSDDPNNNHVVEDDTTLLVQASEIALSSTTELRLSPRTLDIPEPSIVVQAYLQYLYTLTLCTPLQLDPAVLGALLAFAKTYDDEPLRALVTHALHDVLDRHSEGERSASAALVYDAATLGGCMALQIRALRILMRSRCAIGY